MPLRGLGTRQAARKLLSRLRPVSHRVAVWSWNPVGGTNFGDALSIDVVNRMLARHGLAAQTEVFDDRRRYRRRLLAVGSILHNARPGDTVWGSGINGKNPASMTRQDFRGIDFRACRGPLTRQFVNRNRGHCPAVFGDPAILLPTLFPEESPAGPDRAGGGGGGGDIIVIPNIIEEALGLFDELPPGTRKVSPNQDWRDVLREITGAQVVLSSSLHGLILADVYGVPFVRIESLIEPSFKYMDYFLATGRSDVQTASTVEQALTLSPQTPYRDGGAQDLLRSFPADIFAAG